MTKLEDALFTVLNNDTSLQALVSDRIYPTSMPKGTVLPAIDFRRVSAQRTYTFDAFDTGSAYVNATVQFDCWSNSPKEAMDVGEALVLALSGYSGDVDGTLLGSSFTELELDDYNGETKLFRRIVDFRIGYEDDVHS